MTTEVDYLADIAAKTVKCPCATDDTENWCGRCAANFTVVKGYCRPLCQQCRNGSGRVPDPRFNRLRIKKVCDNLGHVVDAQHNKIYCKCYTGYTVIRDLGTLLECAVKANKYGVPYSDALEKMQYMDFDSITPETLLETAAKAIWEWLEQEGKKYE